MQNRVKILYAVCAVGAFHGACYGKSHELITCAPVVREQVKPKKLAIQIILGSTRQGRISDKIARELQKMVKDRTDITTEIIDLRDFNLPFLHDAVAPASRDTITDPIIRTWSNTITKADAFIMVVPEYNGGYPGVLKNALDLLYKEWNGKPVAFVGYSGGPTGGTSVIAQLRTVAHSLKMVPVSGDIKIPHSWKAFDEKGNLVDPSIASQLNNVINQLRGK